MCGCKFCLNLISKLLFSTIKNIFSMKRTAFSLIAIALFFTGVQAQVRIPAASPQCKISQSVGLMEVSLDYSRPSVKGRKIFGELVPYGQVWRTGANASTKITFSDDVKLEGRDAPAGTYALYTIPNKDKWTIIIHKNTQLWGSSGYNQEEELMRFDVKPARTEFTETFTIGFTNLTGSSANIRIAWENTAVEFKMETDSDAKVMASIEETIGSGKATPNDYNAAASYLFETNRDLNKALEYVNLALAEFEKQQRNVFWVVHLKAKILAGLNQFSEAVEAAKKSKELAQEANNDDYVRLNDKLIKAWQAKI